MRLDQEDIELIANTVVDRFAVMGMDAERHAQEHKFISEFIEERAERRRMFSKVRESTLGYLAIAVIAGVGTLAYKGIEQLIQRISQQ